MRLALGKVSVSKSGPSKFISEAVLRDSLASPEKKSNPYNRNDISHETNSNMDKTSAEPKDRNAKKDRNDSANT